MNAKEYIKHLLSIDNYSFSVREIAEATDGTSNSLKFELHRLSEKGEVINLRKGFYLIITPKYSLAKKLPIQLYCDKLFKYLNKNYYVGLFSAAKLHEVSDLKGQRDYFITEQPKFNDISKSTIEIGFFTTRNWSERNIQLKESDAGNYKVSSPALTIADLIHYQTKLGGINGVVATIGELAKELTNADMEELLSWYSNKSTLQRYGFLLEELEIKDELQELIYKKLKSLKFFPVLLSPKSKEKAGAVDNRWKVDVNVKLHSL